MKEVIKLNEINLQDTLVESIELIFKYIDLVDIISIFLMFFGMFLIGKWLFNSRKYANNMAYWILMLWINAIPIYIGAIILGFKYGFN